VKETRLELSKETKEKREKENEERSGKVKT